MTEYENTVAAVQELLSVGYPANSTAAIRESFDINHIFTALTRVAPEAGYVLDYVLGGSDDFGFPVLYSRRQGSQSLSTTDEVESLPEPARTFPFHAVVRQSPGGFFDLAVLRLLGDKFFLRDHAHYMNVRIVCGESALRGLGGFLTKLLYKTREIPRGTLDLVREEPLSPAIKVDNGVATVGMVVFSPWKGFIRNTTSFQVTAPHRVLDEKTHLVAEYNCGVVF